MTHLDYNFTKLYRISRPKLTFPRGAPDHWGLAIHDTLRGDVMVCHTTPEKGWHIGSEEEFAAGLPCQLEEVPLTEERWQRLALAISERCPYDPLFANCQQKVTTITDGWPSSPTLEAILGCALILFLLGFAWRYTK